MNISVSTSKGKPLLLMSEFPVLTEYYTFMTDGETVKEGPTEGKNPRRLARESDAKVDGIAIYYRAACPIIVDGVHYTMESYDLQNVYFHVGTKVMSVRQIKQQEGADSPDALNMESRGVKQRLTTRIGYTKILENDSLYILL